MPYYTGNRINPRFSDYEKSPGLHWGFSDVVIQNNGLLPNTKTRNLYEFLYGISGYSQTMIFY